MPDLKEKLVELKKVLRECLHFNYDVFSCDMSLDVDLTAENLIAHGVTVQELDGCEYCNGLPFSQMEDFTMPNASKQDYDIVTIRYCPMCGRKLPQPPKEDDYVERH